MADKDQDAVTSEQGEASGEKLIVLFDGTWNDPQDQTNVFLMSQCIKPTDDKGNRQRFFYDPGVGTSPFTRFLGGTTGWGLTKNLMQGYGWLAKHYHQNEQIWIFGFSRGAYTARSLAGLIRKCGVLRTATPDLLEQAKTLYRNKALSPNSKECIAFRKAYCDEPKVHFLGIWDTVGALGVPGTVLSERGIFKWHDTKLSRSVLNAFHAVALDEHRAAYDTALWTLPVGSEETRDPKKVEQRWFIGAHANVGGGYKNDELKQIPFKWMAEKAQDKGLVLDLSRVVFDQDAWKTSPRDSYEEFLKGLYGMFRRFRGKGDDQGRFYRAYAGNKPDELKAVNVSVDESVWKKWKAEGYRPKTLVKAEQSPPSQP
ncbi:hypothetical protein D515_01056 [Grimontia indica]|uniref:T6SS Phospholipase effector Tle1-like catalytic domain-containing protein n=1 Tax=Grimontia indica TaxID=1056512 RepID=R1GUT5_9GAMM|nr:DUF2235 domain-containing protein [Grimontia indica]EOD79923.1 hypothetical protein D515_01056 [Grimontia indica]